MNPVLPEEGLGVNNIGENGARIVNVSKNTLLADKIELANTFLRRLIGLLGRQKMNKSEALILIPSNCIHSLFMRFTIDVVFLDKFGKVIGISSSFKPFRLSPVYFNSNLVIEFPENTLKLAQTQLGDIIRIIRD